MANVVNHKSVRLAAEDPDPEILVVSLMANLGARLDHTESDSAAAAITTQIRSLAKELAEIRAAKAEKKAKETGEPTDAIEAAIQGSRK